MISSRESLKILKEGNQRFINGEQTFISRVNDTNRSALAKKQDPFAIILGCSDSRAPAEIIFDQGLGDLFVIRVAGNIVAPTQIGSVEFAVEQFGTPLVVVLGHTNCGAIEATIEQLNRPSEQRSPNLRTIVERIQPSVEALIHSHKIVDAKQLRCMAVRANIKASVQHLRMGSQILKNLIQQNALSIIGAEYSLETGKVEFLSA